MNVILKAVVLLLVARSCQCFASEDTNVIAAGAWSEAVSCTNRPDCGSVRARLIISYGYSPNYAGKTPETLVYLELQKVGMSDPLDIYFDPRKLECELRDENERLHTNSGGGNGGFPSPGWITLPRDATIRLRTSWYGYGMPRNNGLMIPVFHELTIQPGDTNNYFLTSKLTVVSPTNHLSPPGHQTWEGTLMLPRMKISAVQP